jgi:lysophospholipase L1-like esterase
MSVWLYAALLLAQPPIDEAREREFAAQRRLLSDWGGLTRYGSDNSELKLKEGERRVVFLGDEITEYWPREFFSGKPYLNRGITRQTTPQMLVRFRQDVIALKPAAVVIQAGLNDLAGYAGPQSQGTIEDHYRTMVELAKVHKIKVVLASLTPVCACPETYAARRPAGKIIGLNSWLREFARESGAVYLDLYTPLAKGRAIDPALTENGLLPNAEGYKRLGVAAELAIGESLR